MRSNEEGNKPLLAPLRMKNNNLSQVQFAQKLFSRFKLQIFHEVEPLYGLVNSSKTSKER